MNYLVYLCLVFGGNGAIDEACVNSVRSCVTAIYIDIGKKVSPDDILEVLALTKTEAERYKMCSKYGYKFNKNR